MKTLNTQFNFICKKRVRMNDYIDIYVTSRHDRIVGNVRIRNFKGYLRFLSMFSNQSWTQNISVPLVLKRGKR